MQRRTTRSNTNKRERHRGRRDQRQRARCLLDTGGDLGDVCEMGSSATTGGAILLDTDHRQRDQRRGDLLNDQHRRPRDLGGGEGLKIGPVEAKPRTLHGGTPGRPFFIG